nr:BPSS1780 family membrane protein [uncultured Caldimonas sp.]
MKLRLVPARQGALWVRQAFRVFFRQPLAFSALFFLFVFGAFLLLVLPLVGPLVMLTLLPIVTLGFMIATQHSMSGRFPLPGVFLHPFRGDRSRVRALLQLGIGYAVASLLLMWLADLLDGGKFAQLQEAVVRGGESNEAVDSSGAQTGLLLRLVLALPLSIAFWHAPALVHWFGVSTGKSVFFSLVACWRNRGAFVVYGLTWAGVIALFGIMSTLVFSLLSAPQLASLAAFPAALMFSTVFYVSLYFTFVDCFEVDPEGTSHDNNETLA